MSTIVTRAGKGSPLTNAEGDANFTNLNNDKLEAADLIAADTSYDNTDSGLVASNVQSAIDEIQDKKLNIADLAANVVFYPTDAASDISTYFKLVTSTEDADYDDTAVDISTGTITTTDQFIAALASEAGVLSGSTGVISITTVGNVRRVSGFGQADFYFEVYKRDSVGTETLMGTSNSTTEVAENTYEQFYAACLINSTTFTETDRIVFKYYGNRTGGIGDSEFEFQFGGTAPVRSNLPVPVNVVSHANDAEDIIVDTSNFNDILSGADNDVQAALDTLDDHNHDGDYATAAQGALADSALQSSDIGVSVQGYSSVLAGTTASFTTADESKLDGIEALADVTDTANVTAAGALMDSEVTNLAAVKAFDPTDYATAAQGSLADSALQDGDTVASLVITSADINGGTIDGVTIGGSSAGAITGTSLTATTSATLQHSSSTKLATTSTGIDVTGTVTADGLTVEGSGASDITVVITTDENNSKAELRLQHDSAGQGGARFYADRDTQEAGIQLDNNPYYNFYIKRRDAVATEKKAFGVGTNGDIYFYEDTGTTAKFFWDASAERLGIGTNSPSEVLTVASATRSRISITDTTNSKASMDSLIEFDGTDGRGGYIAHTSGDLKIINDLSGQNLAFGTVGSERMRITSGGNLLLGGTSDQGRRLQVTGTLSLSDAAYQSIADASVNSSGVLSISSYRGGGSTIIFNTNTSGSGVAERMRIDSSGNVGIGTSSPATKLHVAGDTTFGGAIDETVYNLTGTAIDPSNGTIQYKTLSANTTLTDSLAEGESITLMIDDGSAYTITWPTMTWVNNGGSAPTLATSGYTTVALWKVSTTLYGALVGDGT